MENLKKCILLVYKKNLKEDIDKILTSNSDIKKYAYVLHDVSNYSHYHIYLDFVDKSIDINEIAELFNINKINIQPVKVSESDVLQYFVNLPNSKIVSNFVNF